MQLQAETGDMMRSQSDSMLGLTWMFQGSDALMIASVQPHEWSLRPQDAMTSSITTHGARWLNDLGKSAVAAHPALNGYAAAMPAYIYSLMDPIVWGGSKDGIPCRSMQRARSPVGAQQLCLKTDPRFYALKGLMSLLAHLDMSVFNRSRRNRALRVRRVG